MMRSILWISSRAPSSPFSIGCVALPQPRSRIALAAAMRAGGGALVFLITPTRTFSAVLVWLRAIERISVIVLVIAFFASQLAAGAWKHIKNHAGLPIKEICGMIASRDHFRREPYLHAGGRVRA